MTDQYKKDGILLLFLLTASCLLFFYGCIHSKKNLMVQKGDRAQLQYTCYISDGSIIATTSKEIAENETYTKSDIFMPQKVYAPSFISCGEEVNEAEGQLKPFVDEISMKLSQLIIGTEVNKHYHFVINSNIPANLKKEERFLTMARVRKRPKTNIIPMSHYKLLSNGLDPEVGHQIKIEQGIYGKVISVDDKGIVLTLSLTPGSKVPAPPFGMGTVRQRGDIYEIIIEANTGDLVRVGPYLGKIIEINDRVITMDFGHPFGGGKLACDITVEEVEQVVSSREIRVKTSQEARKLLDGALEKARNSDNKVATIDLTKNEHAEDSERVQSGDLVTVHYTVALDNGEIYRTTRASVAHDHAKIKTEGFRAPEGFLPEEVIVGEPSEIPWLNEALMGLRINEKKKTVVPVDMAFGFSNNQKIITYPRVRRLPRTHRMPIEEYVRKYDTSPSLDASVSLNPYYDAVVVEVTSSDVILEAVVEDGKLIEDSLGTTEIHLDGDEIVASLQPKKGAPFELNTEKGVINGRIIWADEDSFTVDFNHPLAGKNIVLDLEVVSLTKAAQLKQIELPWFADHDRGLDLAMHEEKPAVLLLYADWCGWSKKIINETFQHPSIKALKDEFVWLKINSDKERMFYDIYEQESYPMVVLLDSHSQVINKINGFIDARSLRKELNHCLETF